MKAVKSRQQREQRPGHGIKRPAYERHVTTSPTRHGICLIDAGSRFVKSENHNNRPEQDPRVISTGYNHGVDLPPTEADVL
jgi:hypothetical protein